MGIKINTASFEHCLGFHFIIRDASLCPLSVLESGVVSVLEDAMELDGDESALV